MPLERDDPLLQAIAHNVRRLRLEQGLIQPELAKAVGVSFRMICRIERPNGQVPAADVIYTLADVLGVSADDLRTN